MEKNGVFANFDNEHVFDASHRLASDKATQNFVIEFGSEEAQIAFDLNDAQFQEFLNGEAPKQRPVRWINIWGPHLRPRHVECLAQKYGFSVRLEALIQEEPAESSKEVEKPSRWSIGRHSRPEVDTEEEKGTEKETEHIDVELALQNGNCETEHQVPKRNTSTMKRNQATHYKIVQQMINYHAIDCGEKFICLGANWMHERNHQTKKSDDRHEQARRKVTEAEIKLEELGNQRRLYTWLVLCNDNTVITIHEHDNHPQDLGTTRSHLLSVFEQCSKWQSEDVSAISRLALRTSLASTPDSNWGKEGASNLFYYLFDDWRAVYGTVESFQRRLLQMQERILNVTSRKSVDTVEIDILPALHLLGKQIRQMHHVYVGYKNLVQRTLEPPKSAFTGDPRTPTSPTSHASPGLRVAQIIGRQGPELAPSAVARFERLSDRLQLLILSETQEFLMEKDALANTYFSINAQKDSEATARLTRAAGLLAKLSVLFLPVSLMTSYFSIQIQELEGVYTVKDYWYSFAIIMCISFLFLFFFGRLLMYITETFDNKIARRANMQIAKVSASILGRTKRTKKL